MSRSGWLRPTAKAKRSAAARISLPMRAHRTSLGLLTSGCALFAATSNPSRSNEAIRRSQLGAIRCALQESASLREAPDWRLRAWAVRIRLPSMGDITSEKHGEFPRTERTRVTRKPDRGSYDRDLIYGILDQAFVCTVGFVVDGLPFVVPTNYVRVGDKLYLHGSTASRLMKTLTSGAPFTINVTILDGIVFSPTATGHSVNYRSVVVMGKAEIIEGHDAKLAAMRDFVEYVLKGRWNDVRRPTEQELKGTMVIAVPLREARTKVRTGLDVNDAAS